MAWYKIFDSVDAARSRVGDREMLLIQVKGLLIFLTRLENDFFAAENTCPHEGGYLNEGTINEWGEVECPWHQYRFRVNDGRKVFGKDCPDLKTYELKVEENGLFINVDI